jgi:hypothetical protein
MLFLYVHLWQVHAYRKPYVIDRTFRFYQPEGDILKRAIQLLPGKYTYILLYTYVHLVHVV